MVRYVDRLITEDKARKIIGMNKQQFSNIVARGLIDSQNVDGRMMFIYSDVVGFAYLRNQALKLNNK